VQLLTKYVPNIYQGVPSTAAVEASVRRSMSSLQVRPSTWAPLRDTPARQLLEAARQLPPEAGPPQHQRQQAGYQGTQCSIS
jgi:hypothetical protein